MGTNISRGIWNILNIVFESLNIKGMGILKFLAINLRGNKKEMGLGLGFGLVGRDNMKAVVWQIG